MEGSQYGKRKYKWDDLLMYLNTMTTMTGLTVQHCMGMIETVDYILMLDRWWNKEWDSHRGHIAMYKSSQMGPYVSLRKPSLLRRIASELPGIGFGRSKNVESKFQTVARMLSASEREWQEVEGIGKVVAKACWECLHNG